MSKKSDILVENIVLEKVEKLKILESYYVLNEASFSKIISTYFDIGFIIISAERSCEAQKGRVCNEKELIRQRQKNKENEEKIKFLIRSAGYSYIPTYGGYKEKVIDKDGNEKLVDSPKPEKSFIIPSVQVASINKRKDYTKLKSLGIGLSRKFNQDAFLYKPPSTIDKNAYFIDKNGEILSTFNNVTANDIGQPYFTQLRKMNPDRRFTMVEQLYFIPKSPCGMSEAIKRRGEIFYRILEQESDYVQKEYAEHERKQIVREEKHRKRHSS